MLKSVAAGLKKTRKPKDMPRACVDMFKTCAEKNSY